MPFLFGLIVLLCVYFHARLTRSSLKAGAFRLLERVVLKASTISQQEIDRRQRYEEESLKMHANNFDRINCFMIHVLVSGFLLTFYHFLQEPSAASLLVASTFGGGYSMHACFEAGLLELKTRAHLRALRVAVILICGHWYVALYFESRAEALYLQESAWGVALMLITMVFFQFSLLLPLQLIGAALLIYKHCELAGFKDISPSLVCLWLSLQAFGLFGVMVLTYAIQSDILAKIDSDYHSSCLQALRTVLKGVSDGGLVLSARNFHILEDASSVERLLKSPKALANTSFLDLLLDTESRVSFVDFLQSDHVAKGGSVPPGLKISLQGAEGPVSLDIFCTRGDGYYLCALQEEPGQYPVPPDAEPSVVTPKSHRNPPSSTSSGASKEVAAAVGELCQVSLVVNDETTAMDIEEVTLSFLRNSRHDKMPTLRQFMRVSDWERLQPIFDELRRLDGEAPIELQSSLMLRIPGRIDNYIRAKEVSVGLADEPIAGNVQTFQINLGRFVAHKPRKSEGAQDLESIHEDKNS